MIDGTAVSSLIPSAALSLVSCTVASRPAISPGQGSGQLTACEGCVLEKEQAAGAGGVELFVLLQAHWAASFCASCGPSSVQDMFLLLVAASVFGGWGCCV